MESDTGTKFFIVALTVIVNIENNPGLHQQPSRGMIKLWCSHTVEHHGAEKRMKIFSIL